MNNLSSPDFPPLLPTKFTGNSEKLSRERRYNTSGLKRAKQSSELFYKN